jgi:hypothetical protein
MFVVMVSEIEETRGEIKMVHGDRTALVLRGNDGGYIALMLAQMRAAGEKIQDAACHS